MAGYASPPWLPGIVERRHVAADTKIASSRVCKKKGIKRIPRVCNIFYTSRLECASVWYHKRHLPRVIPPPPLSGFTLYGVFRAETLRTSGAHGYLTPAFMTAHGTRGSGRKHFKASLNTHAKHVLSTERVHYVRPIRPSHWHVLYRIYHILHGFSRRILRKPEDSLANTARRLSIFCNWTRACIVLLAFDVSLLCSASSWSHTARFDWMSDGSR